MASCYARIVVGLLVLFLISNLQETSAARARGGSRFRSRSSGTTTRRTVYTYTSYSQGGLAYWKIILIVSGVLFAMALFFTCFRLWSAYSRRRERDLRSREAPRFENPIYRVHRPEGFEDETPPGGEDGVGDGLSDKNIAAAPPPPYDEAVKADEGAVDEKLD
ncbi:uncharacterized protein LOC119727317 [Patiria miniata]|uniref:Uncharacterized protein n=1 Tax=Patiria miniata TaxID=46514 RepID=A0A913ZV06_PATMI|nr:uncharacterized protein LOC119727317 [Patiria miniata]